LLTDMLDAALRIVVERHSRAGSRAIMTISSAILIAANVSLVMTMLCAGMGAVAGDRTYLSCRRSLLVRSLVSTLVLQPAFAVWLCYAFALPPSAKVALLGLAIAPLPPILPSGLMKVRGTRSFEIALSFVVAVATVATIPLSLAAFHWFVGAPTRIDFVMLAWLVGLNILLPVAVGFAGRRLSAETAVRAVTLLTIGAMGILGLVLVALLLRSRPAIPAIIGNGTLIAIVLLAVAGLGIGHMCGGPARKNRRVLAMATATRHPAVAIALASAASPADERVAGVVIALAVLVAGVAAIPYLPLSRFKLPRM
jgi:BASS family bile acid:Na+ symporter